MIDMTIDDEGWLQACDRLHSPNCDARPHNAEIKLIVIHGISLPPGEFGGGYIEQFFCNQLDANTHPYFADICQMRVSAHCLIERDGRLLQFVPFHKRAWHAGVSSWRGQSACNDFSIGIELEGTDELAYSDQQYQQLNRLLASLKFYYPAIQADAIRGHSDIAVGRKTDPGYAFDWSRLQG